MYLVFISRRELLGIMPFSSLFIKPSLHLQSLNCVMKTIKLLVDYDKTFRKFNSI